MKFKGSFTCWEDSEFSEFDVNGILVKLI